MILIDAIYIYDGGGKVLFDLLLDELVQKKVDVFYLVDKRIENDFKRRGVQNVRFLNASLIERTIFYLVNYNKFNVILCFANVPPTIPMKGFVFTYFQNVLFLEKSNPLRGLAKFKLEVKKRIIYALNKNTNNWIVQTHNIQERMMNEWEIPQKLINVVPLFNPIKKHASLKICDEDKGFNKFLYVSEGHEHKNHLRLFEAFIEFLNFHPNNKLYVTIGKECDQLLGKLASFKCLQIVNLGTLPYDELIQQYSDTDIVIYPSLSESFGLGLIEAAQLQIPIIASNLPFVHAIVQPNLVFDPESNESILSTLLNYKCILGAKSSSKSENQVDTLINLLINHNEK
jgi:glycosyltransferase involved in cell wall biosynthesis